jgi:membrane-associated phospholipid phosphatase
MNNEIFFILHSLANKSGVLDEIVVFFAVYFPYLVVISAGLFLLFHYEILKKGDNLSKNISVVLTDSFKAFYQKKKEISISFITAILAWILARIIKILIHFPRPFTYFEEIRPLFIESGYAFPSGHATFFMALAVSIFFFHKKAGSVFIFFAILIGIARVISGIHFPMDILGGFLLGSLIAYLTKNVYNTVILCGKK